MATTHGGITVNDGPETSVPSKLNIEGQNANHPDAAGQALASESEAGSASSTTRDHDQEHEKMESGEGGGGGKPHMEKYAYHCMSPLSLMCLESAEL